MKSRQPSTCFVVAFSWVVTLMYPTLVRQKCLENVQKFLSRFWSNIKLGIIFKLRFSGIVSRVDSFAILKGPLYSVSCLRTILDEISQFIKTIFCCVLCDVSIYKDYGNAVFLNCVCFIASRIFLVIFWHSVFSLKNDRSEPGRG